MEMVIQAPPPDLAAHVVALWTLRGRADGPYVGLPKPFAEVIVSLSGHHTWQEHQNSEVHCFRHGWLTPIQTGPRFASTDGYLYLVGARLRLHASAHLFGVFGTHEPRIPLPLDALIGGAAIALRDQLLAQKEPTDHLRVMAQWLRVRLQNLAPTWVPSPNILQRLGWRVDALAETVELSPRGLHKRFVEQMGIGPKLWLQVSRFDAVLRHKPSQSGLAEVAQRFGFADQSHMNVEFRRFAGTSPQAYVSRRHQRLAPESAPHFLPGCP